MTTENFDAVAAAYAQVKQTGESLLENYKATCADIHTAEAELKALPLPVIPFEDMKAAILEFITASGDRYAADQVRRAISAFATGMHGGGEIGKPLNFASLEGAIVGSEAALAWAQLMTPEKYQFNDQVFYCFFADLVKAGLRKIMDQMTPEEFGYGEVHANEIGSERHERRAAIATLKNKLNTLQETKAGLAQKLRTLGFSVPADTKVRP